MAGIAAARDWQILPINLMPVEHGIVERIGARQRGARLLPPTELNDAFLVVGW